MKIGYIVAILVALLLIAGCKSEPVVEPEPVVVEEPEPVVVEEPSVAEDAPAAASEGLSYESVDERAQRLIDACKAGNEGLCAALKTQYGIEVSSEGDLVEVEEPMADETVEE
jgi:hypothetical protein